MRIDARTLRLLPLTMAWLVGTNLATDSRAGAPAPAPIGASSVAAARSPVHEIPRSQRGERYYAHLYGVDQLQVRPTASGMSVEFRYRVVDPERASWVNDRKAMPMLTDQRAGVRLHVAEMENLGALRQTVRPAAGKEYWMVFHNAGKRVKPGDKVDIEIGHVRLNGLTVQ